MEKGSRKDEALRLIALGEKIARDRVKNAPLLGRVLEDFEEMREIVQLALASQNEMVLATHRLMMAIVETKETGMVSFVECEERKVRGKIDEILVFKRLLGKESAVADRA